MSWIVKEEGFDKGKIEFFGSKFLIGNGYFGYRGTLEEYGREELVAFNLAGLFDKNGDKWREPVNAPNPIRIFASFNGQSLDILKCNHASHCQSVDISCALHKRKTEFITNDSARVTVESSRFASMECKNLLVARYSLSADQSGEVIVKTSIDKSIWDLNGPHLVEKAYKVHDNCSCYMGSTIELGRDIAVLQKSAVNGRTIAGHIEPQGNSFKVRVEPHEKIVIDIYCAAAKEGDSGELPPLKIAERVMEYATDKGYEELFAAHRKKWESIWSNIDVKISGDDEAQLAIRYSMYLLVISTPFHTDSVAIPARGLSGQVYKGAMFWDTEIYMMPFYKYSMPWVCRNLAKYRVNTLEGAKRKAAGYGFSGAFFPWESQENGEDGCTDYNINDIFTGRPLRTYFREKQVHISADVAFGILDYFAATGDDGILLEGGAETVFECAKFFYSYSYYKPEKARYELLDVTGADEYHERINNNAFTNVMVEYTLKGALKIARYLRDHYPREYESLIRESPLEADLQNFERMAEKLYIPAPDSSTGILEQFDGYFRLEDITPEKLRERVILENEYLGSPSGLAVNTQMIKQADVVLLNALFRDRYTKEQKLANWSYYEPRTEHGSSLSACIYALVAAECGLYDRAYKYFMKAAAIDLYGGYKLYVGDQYIGGTHPAAGGGSWMVAVLGFGGLNTGEYGIEIKPALPNHWQAVEYNFYYQKQKFSIHATKEKVTVTAFSKNTKSVDVSAGTATKTIRAGETIVFDLIGFGG